MWRRITPKKYLNEVLPMLKEPGTITMFREGLIDTIAQQ